MSDDLVKRLRNTAKWLRLQNEDSRGIYFDRAPFEAADRIAELEAAMLSAKQHFVADEPLKAFVEICAALGERE